MTESTTSFTGIPPPVSILSVIKGIQIRQEDLRDDVVSKMIEEFNGIQIFGEFNQSKIREILQGFNMRH